MNEPKPDSGGSGHAGKFWGITEVLSVFVVGHFLSFLVIPLLRIPSAGLALSTQLKSAEPDYVALAWIMTRVLVVQYICLFALVMVVTRLNRTLVWNDFGFTLGNQNLKSHAWLAIAALAVGALPLQILFAVASFVDLGQGPPSWVIFSKPWPWSFWLFAAAGSFVLVPILEEAFYRGYCQARLQKVLPAGASIVIVSVLFTLTHSQYQRLSILNLGTILGIFVLSLSIGLLFYRTKSLVGPILVHAIVDIPVKPSLQIYRLAVMIFLAFISRREIYSLAVAVRNNFSLRVIPLHLLLSGSVAAAIVAVAFGRFPSVTAVAGALLLLMVLVRYSLKEKVREPG